MATPCGNVNPASRLLMNILAAMAVFERELIVERTKAGLQRARKVGRIGGRPRLVVNRDRIAAMATEGNSMRAIAQELGISASSVCRLLA